MDTEQMVKEHMTTNVELLRRVHKTHDKLVELNGHCRTVFNTRNGELTFCLGFGYSDIDNAKKIQRKVSRLRGYVGKLLPMVTVQTAADVVSNYLIQIK